MLYTTMHDDWNPKGYLAAVDREMGRLENSTAEDILRDAITLVPVDEGTLKKEIELKKSKFERGGWIVVAQGPGNYDKFYASFIELGIHKTRNMPAQPYLRPALKANKGKFLAAIKNSFKGNR